MPHPENINSEQCVLIVGGYNDQIFGPFDTHADALDYASKRDFLPSRCRVETLIPVQCDDDGNWILPE